jgi:hypothetical protein
VDAPEGKFGLSRIQRGALDEVVFLLVTVEWPETLIEDLANGRILRVGNPVLELVRSDFARNE